VLARHDRVVAEVQGRSTNANQHLTGRGGRLRPLRRLQSVDSGAALYHFERFHRLPPRLSLNRSAARQAFAGCASGKAPKARRPTSSPMPAAAAARVAADSAPSHIVLPPTMTAAVKSSAPTAASFGLFMRNICMP